MLFLLNAIAQSSHTNRRKTNKKPQRLISRVKPGCIYQPFLLAETGASGRSGKLSTFCLKFKVEFDRPKSPIPHPQCRVNP